MHIRIVINIDVPEQDKADYGKQINNIIDYVGYKFPGLKQIPYQSPVTVTISEMGIRVGANDGTQP